MNNKMNTRGQVTIFIIIAVLVVGLAVLIYTLTPEVGTTVKIDSDSPEGFLDACLKNHIEEVVETISLQGGSYAPEFFIMHEGHDIEYLCYNEESFALCIVQQPLLKRHIEGEITRQVAPVAEECFKDMEVAFRERGYETKLELGFTKVDILPQRVSSTFRRNVLTLTRGETEVHNNFEIVLSNNLYELIGIAESIISWETQYGDIETLSYMNYYPHLKVEKKKQNDGSTIYILTNRNSGNKFQFASRSNALTAGWT